MEERTIEVWHQEMQEWLKQLHPEDLAWLIDAALLQRYPQEAVVYGS